MKQKLDTLELVENIDYSELQDILQLRPQGGTSIKKVYMLTPEAFKNCLLRARKYPNQKVDPVIYSKYYLLLEKYVFQRCSFKNIENLIFIFKNDRHENQYIMSIQQQQYIQTLIDCSEKMSLLDFFKNIHQKFYSDYDISFMKYFLELTAQEGEFVVHHEKLIEYGVMTSNRSFHVKEKLNALELVENEDYSEMPDIRQLRPQGGTSIKKVYMLTPEAFKNCLLRFGYS